MLRGQQPSTSTAGISQVSLIHSSDSVRSVANATPTSCTAFAPSNRMSKPPVRVVPPPMRHPQSGVAYGHHMAHVSPSPVIGRSPGPNMVPTVNVHPVPARSYDDDYAEHQRRVYENNRIELERRQYAMRMQQQQDQRLQMQQQQNMKRAPMDNDLRRYDMEDSSLKMRNNIRMEEANLPAPIEESKNELRTASVRVDTLRKEIEELYKRRQAASSAAVAEQKRMQIETLHQSHQVQHQQMLNRSQDRSSNQVNEVLRPRASVEPFNIIVAKPELEITKECIEEDVIDSSSLMKQKSCSPPIEPMDSYSGILSVGNNTRQDISPSPPKDPHPTVPSSPPENRGAPEKPLRKQEAQENIVPSQKIENTPSYMIQRPTSLGESMDESKLRAGRTDAVSLRSDSLKATKRRSWAASEGTYSEAETIRRVIEEQKRGKHHFIPEIPVEAEKVEPEPSAQSQSGNNSERSTTEEESSLTSDDEPQVEMELNQRTVKGILRPAGLKKLKRRIEFDPLALMLDAALEGELDLVKTSASKLPDVSAANDEGITALHNAICAGHYEIVKFLIESDADVNAQDSDGWTPLHCAASCNNLPMVRQLVEGGACVLASTLSDMETPVEKCEEDEEGYDGCLRYLAAAHSATGSLNSGKVYAAYDYEPEFEDEMAFKAGDEMRVISKDDKEKGWWTCERSNETTNEKEQGLVPRTYLALYPALKYRKTLGFTMFDLPLEANNNDIN